MYAGRIYITRNFIDQSSNTKENRGVNSTCPLLLFDKKLSSSVEKNILSFHYH